MKKIIVNIWGSILIAINIYLSADAYHSSHTAYSLLNGSAAIFILLKFIEINQKNGD